MNLQHFNRTSFFLRHKYLSMENVMTVYPMVRLIFKRVCLPWEFICLTCYLQVQKSIPCCSRTLSWFVVFCFVGVGAAGGMGWTSGG